MSAPDLREALEALFYASLPFVERSNYSSRWKDTDTAQASSLTVGDYRAIFAASEVARAALAKAEGQQ